MKTAGHGNSASKPEVTQDRLFLSVIFGYFAIQTLVRTVLGGSFEVDEAEMMALARDFRLGYGPQLPLYNWLQAASFHLFGFNTFALTVTKNALLCLTYAGVYLGLRQKLPVRLSLLGTMGLLLLPNLSWEGQRAGSHSIAMYAAMAWCLYVLMRLWKAPQFWHWIALGLILGAGGLAKYNFWLFPVSLFFATFLHPQMRAALWRRELAITLAIAAVLVALPYAWVLSHIDEALASTSKFYHTSHKSSLSPRAQGISEFFTQGGVAMLLPLLTALFAWLPARRALKSVSDDLGIGAWLMIAGAFGLLLSLAGVIVSGSSDVQARWLLPALMPLSIGLMLRAGTAISPRAARNVLRFCALLAILLIAAMADIRLRGAGSDSLRVDLLADEIETQCGTEAPVAFDAMGYYFLGNLKFHRPDWITPSTLANPEVPDGLPCFVVVNTDEPKRVSALIEKYGLSERVLGTPEVRTATLPYRFEDPDVTEDVSYIIVKLKNGAQ
ncbi:ArnT family glycosyltransferase [Celeribacter sp. ULVN23_4]